jgi:hypothetical protein
MPAMNGDAVLLDGLEISSNPPWLDLYIKMVLRDMYLLMFQNLI